MSEKIGKCPVCNKNTKILQSNNPLVQPTCNECVSKTLDYNNIEDGDFFCRTYDIPFQPEVWIRMVKEYKERVFQKYSEFMYDEGAYENDAEETWAILNKEWSLITRHEELIAKIAPIKQGYVERNQIKWGSNYTFSQLIQLENLFVSTLQANDVSNPMQKDAIKKACKLSVSLDKAIMEGDSKVINDLSKAHQNFIKTAKIDDLITAASQDVISNVAQLVEYIENSGFEFKYYDDVDRDIVDKSIKDIQQFIQRLVLDATGLESVFETINKSMKTKDALEADSESYQRVNLEELYEGALTKQSEEFDEELESEQITEDIFDGEEKDFF